MNCEPKSERNMPFRADPPQKVAALTDAELKKAVAAFADYANAEDANLVVEVLNENAALLAAVADNAARQGVNDLAEHVRRLVRVDNQLADLLKVGLDAAQEKAVKEGGVK